MSLATRVLIGLAAGIGTGVFFGEWVSVLGVVGQAFILLLQMSVLPYVTTSLIRGLGGLTYAEAGKLARSMGTFMLVLWSLALSMVVLAPLSYPNWEAASFFSTTLVKKKQAFDFLGLFIPANPFFALSANVVPAVVVFSFALGIALMGIRNKDALLANVSVLTEALGRITGFVVSLAPYGVFAIAANAAGTMRGEELKGLQVYVTVYMGVALLLALWTIPMLVASLTPLSYRDVVLRSRDALVTAFATGSVFVVLPVLALKSREAVLPLAESKQETGSIVDVVIPTSFNFPSSGKLLGLTFIPFAGWLSGFAVSYTAYPLLVFAGLLTFFGSSLAAIPFLLDLLRVPADTFQLFVIADNVIGNRFGALVAATHILALTMLSACAVAGQVRFNAIKLARFAALTVVFTAIVLGGIRLTFEMIGNEYHKYQVFIQRSLLGDPVQAGYLDSPPTGIGTDTTGRSALARILERGFVRVGYFADALPWAFRNEQNELVGFDVEMAHNLARDIGVTVEFVKIARDDLPHLFEIGYLDLVMSGTAVTPQWLQKVAFSRRYLDETLCFIVRDHDRERFSTRQAVKSQESLKLGVPNSPYYAEKLRRYLPKAEIVVLDSPREFFKDKRGDLDAFVYGAASGSSWSLIYPSFSVAVPQPDVLAVPLAYPLPRGDSEMVEFINHWIELKEKDETIERLYDYWILGKMEGRRKPRWSIIRDVLGWVN